MPQSLDPNNGSTAESPATKPKHIMLRHFDQAAQARMEKSRHDRLHLSLGLQQGTISITLESDSPALDMIALTARNNSYTDLRTATIMTGAPIRATTP